MSGSEARDDSGVGRPITDAATARAAVGVDPGLCASCRWARLVTSRTSTFLRCGASDESSTLLRYPPLPVLECAAFAGRDEP